MSTNTFTVNFSCCSRPIGRPQLLGVRDCDGPFSVATLTSGSDVDLEEVSSAAHTKTARTSARGSSSASLAASTTTVRFFGAGMTFALSIAPAAAC